MITRVGFSTKTHVEQHAAGEPGDHLGASEGLDLVTE